MAEMKDSGIEWCGKIPISWNVMPNKYVMHKKKEICPKYNGEDILSLTMDGVIVRDLDAGGKMPASFDGYQRVHPHNLLMCLFDYDVTPRCIGLIQNEGLTSPAYSQFVMKNGNDARYYYYYYLMIDNTKELLHLAKNLRHSFTEDQLGIINTPVPPVEIQKQIAKYLDQKCEDIDAVYVEIEKQIETLEEYKKSIITEAVTKGLDPDVEMKDSGIEWIGMIPKNWSVTRMQEIGTYKKGPFGSAITKNMFVEKDDNTYKVYEQKNAIYKNVELGYYYIPFSIYKRLKEFAIIPQDIIVSCAGTIGECYIMPNNMEKGIINQALMRIRLKENINKNYFIYVFDIVLTYANLKYSNGSAMKNIPPFSVLKKLGIPLPSVQEQEKIANYLDDFCNEIDGVIVDKKKQLETLEQYKKSLIYEYVTGKKEVK